MTDDRPTVVLVHPLLAASGEELLRAHARVVRPDSDGEEAIEHALNDAEGIIVWSPARLTARLIESARRLRVIGTPGSGVDPIDVGAATRRGIPVVHTRGASPHGVAEYALSAMVMAHRNVLGIHTRLLDGSVDWRGRLRELAAMELTGSTIGIVGYGFIGRDVARMAASAFQATVLAYDPGLDRSIDLGPARLVATLDELLDASQTVSIHCPLNASTRALIGSRELELLGPDGVLVNAARGGIVDGPALLHALRTSTIKGAVVDVFDPEPPPATLLAELAATPGLVVTPHVAGITHQGNHRVSVAVVEGVLAALRGERPSVVANPEIYER